MLNRNRVGNFIYFYLCRWLTERHQVGKTEKDQHNILKVLQLTIHRMGALTSCKYHLSHWIYNKLVILIRMVIPWRMSIYRVFSVFTVKPSKKKNANHSIQKVRIWEMKEDKNTKSLGKNQVWANFHIRDIRKSVLPKLNLKSFVFRRHVGAALRAKIWPPETNRNICFWVFLLVRKFLSWGTHKD